MKCEGHVLPNIANQIRQMHQLNASSTFKLLISLVFLSVFHGVYGQVDEIGWHRRDLDSLEKVYQEKGFSYHSVFQPAPRFLKACDFADTIIQVAPRQLNICASPLLSSNVGLGLGNSIAAYASAGALVRFTDFTKWDASIGYTFNYRNGPDYLMRWMDSTSIMPGVGKAHFTEGLGYHAHNFFGKLGYQAGKRVYLEAGRGKNFWGDGYRSLILSDNAAAYPYARLSLDIWKFRYNAMWAQTTFGSEKKYFAMHGISMNATKRIQFSLFEMVTWQAVDSLSNRQLDFHYLNPILFYRPVEYAQGSADNVILGAGMKWRPTKKIQVYSQVVIDEFLLKEIKQQLGWWANKFGGQVGVRVFDLVPGLNIQSELNAVRPFTYTHGSPLQSWGHNSQPLAHPWGANFWEWVNIAKYQKGLYTLTNKNIWGSFGRDGLDDDGDGIGENWGGDIFRSYRKPYRQYGNKLLQGERSIIHFNEFSISRKFDKYPNLVVSATYLLRYEHKANVNFLDNYIFIGIQMDGFLKPVTDF
jgi:hypothetical protein